MPGTPAPMAARPPASPARLPWPTRLADHLVIALALVLGIGSIVLFAWIGNPISVPMHLSSGAALWWNALVSMIFFAQHSGLVRRPVRARLAAVIPARYDGAFYAITSGLALTLVAVLYQRVEAPPLFVLVGLPKWIVVAADVLAVAWFAWGIVALRTFDPCGIRPIREHLRTGTKASPADEPGGAMALVIRGPYRWVRHPLYSAVIVLLWASPQMTYGRLELAVLWTAWICVGTLLEERDLAAEFGETYRRYRKQVPMLIPWRGPVRASTIP